MLPNVGIDIGCQGFLLIRCERRRRKAGENLIQYEDLNVGLRLLLLPEPIELIQSGLD